jgi:small subunit ribosomal protein S2
MVDTCCDPTTIDYVIPANDDAAKSIQLITETLCNAVAEGLEERRIEKEKEKDEAPVKEEAPVKRPRKAAAPKAEAAEEPKNEE